MQTKSEIITFNGEWLWLGNLGQIFVVLMFVTALLSTIFYFRSVRNDSNQEALFARRSFYVHTFSVIAVFVILFAIIFNHRFEYYYAWRHSSLSLPVYYMISCFWEGQEGSFLLWLFWNAVIGLVLIKVSKKWERSTMTIIAFAQIALSSMLVGFHLGDFKFGSSPFDLLREQRPDFLQIPILGQLGIGNYLQVFKDGNGLNQLLQNYWMVIHPPTLFFGFAVAIVPFAYSIAGLWRKEDRSWIDPALIWGLICVGILGTGIIMGGFWAYESLSFGGYWAWDPVENASLLPWLIMAAAVHLMLISKNTGRHIFTSHLLTQLSFWLVLYATFLTRSGILGEASVHSFTDLGLSGQLLIFLLAFIVISWASTIDKKKSQNQILVTVLGVFALVIALSYAIPETQKGLYEGFHSIVKNGGIVAFLIVIVLFVYNLYKRTKTDLRDEHLSSREFWMFMGSMFLILSLIQVFSGTSIPVFNKLFGFKTATPVATDYNRVQLWMSMPIMALMSIGQFFTYRESKDGKLYKNISISFALAFIVTILVNLNFGVQEFKYLVFLFLAVWLVVANAMYFILKKKSKVFGWGSSVSHVGFGVLLTGVLISSVNQKVLTSTQTGIDMAPEVNEKGQTDVKGIAFNRENRILYKNQNIEIGDYFANYTKKEVGIGKDSIDKHFNILFVDKVTKDSFLLRPKTQNNPKMGLIAEPSTKHYISKDVFSHVNYESGMDKVEPFSGFKTSNVKVGQTFSTESGKCQMVVKSIDRYSSNQGIVLSVNIMVNRLNDSILLHPEFRVNEQNGSFEANPAESNELGLILMIQNIKILDPDPTKQNIEFQIQSGEKTPVKDYIVLKVISFPWINLVWAGTIIMLIGFILAVVNRIKIQQKLAA